MLAIKFVLLVLSVFIGYFLGYFLTETKYRLADYSAAFQFEVWECRKCLSFHISWVTSTFIALLFSDWCMVAIGIFFAFMLYFGLVIDQRKKTISINK